VEVLCLYNSMELHQNRLSAVVIVRLHAALCCVCRRVVGGAAALLQQQGAASNLPLMIAALSTVLTSLRCCALCRQASGEEATP
jgi:hypothetical protein